MALLCELRIASIIHPHRLHNPQMRQGQALRAARSTKHIPAVPTVMFPVREGEFLPTSHTHIRVHPLRRRGRVEHTARHLLSGREVEAFVLERSIGFGDIHQRIPSLSPARPILDQLQNLRLDVRIYRLRRRKRIRIAPRLQQTDQIIHKLPTRDLLHEMGAAILHARIDQVEGGELDVGILVADPALQAAHGFLGLDGFAADGIGDFEVEGDVFERGRGGPLDLSVQLGVGRAAEPRRHLD